MVELAVRVAARGEHEHRAAQRRLAVTGVDRDVLHHEPNEHREQLRRACVEAAGLERF